MDKYDKAIAYLTENPHQIFESWQWGGSLFLRTGNPRPRTCDSDLVVGCLTQIRADVGYCTPTPELTKAIRNDDRIPKRPEQITVGNLPLFAEWQRRLDKELGEDRQGVPSGQV